MFKITEWGTVAGGVQIALAAPMAAYPPAHAIEVSMVLKNVDATAVTIVQRSPWVDYQFDLTDENGSPVPRTRFFEMMLDAPTWESALTDVPPGGVVVSTVFVNRMFDMSLSTAYEFSVARSVTPLGGQPILVTSNRLAIEVADRLAPDVFGDQRL
jgi:hypothetical protein